MTVANWISPARMTASAPTEGELQFYYFGLYAVLKRYRFMTMLGWLIVLLGCASVPFGWEVERTGLIDLALSCCTIVAGLALVQQSVSSLASYINVPFDRARLGDSAEDNSVVVKEIKNLMNEIEEGGWQEAYAALRALREMSERHGLPPL